MTFNTNNGNALANAMHDFGLLSDGLTIDELYDRVQGEGTPIQVSKMVKRKMQNEDDSFNEDFMYRCAELGYELKY